MIQKYFFPILLVAVVLFGCRDESQTIGSTQTDVTTPEETLDSIVGFFLLNQGNFGSNKATLDYFDYATGVYHKNIFAERNPTVVKSLGDVGNDLQIYGNKLYAVINNSNLIEVMELSTAKHITEIAIPNARYIAFHEGYGYATSYAGEVILNDPNARLGYVAKIDTTTLAIVDTCNVGYQPEELVIVDGKIYVANSGGYCSEYDYTVSVIDIATFTETEKITVAPNLHRLAYDGEGYIYVASRGDYYSYEPQTYVIDIATHEVSEPFVALPCSDMMFADGQLYVMGTSFSYETFAYATNYARIDVAAQQIATTTLITDGTDSNISYPFCIAYNAQRSELFVTDAKSFTVSGTLYCFGSDGVKKWSVETGEAPACIAFTTQALVDID